MTCDCCHTPEIFTRSLDVLDAAGRKIGEIQACDLCRKSGLAQIVADKANCHPLARAIGYIGNEILRRMEVSGGK